MIDENVLFLTFDASGFNGPRLKYYKGEIYKFVKIEYPGLHFNSTFTCVVNYSIDKQLIRKLKLMSMTNQIKHNSKEDLILSFIEKSKPLTDKKEFVYPDSNYWYNSDVGNDILFEEREMLRVEKLESNKNKSKMYSQKIKQYNNNRNYRR